MKTLESITPPIERDNVVSNKQLLFERPVNVIVSETTGNLIRYVKGLVIVGSMKICVQSSCIVTTKLKSFVAVSVAFEIEVIRRTMM